MLTVTVQFKSDSHHELRPQFHMAGLATSTRDHSFPSSDRSVSSCNAQLLPADRMHQNSQEQKVGAVQSNALNR